MKAPLATLLPPLREEYERQLAPVSVIAHMAPLPLRTRVFAQSWLRNPCPKHCV